jgi:orotidine-5'-phosphate decarboxylase
MNSKIIVALDYDNAQSALAFAKQVTPDLCKLKVGKELFTSAGPQLVEQLVDAGFAVFLDLKFHDIPNTVAKACEAAANLGVWMVNVHASGGQAMMQAAREGVDKARVSNKPLLTAVTVLTSMDADTLSQVGVQRPLQEQVLALASLAKQSHLDGVVCSAQEASLLREHLGANFCLVTPGIGPASAAKDDQTRIVTPKEAITLGSHYLVIGRPITKATDPIATLSDINKEINLI